jgi:hypothetical protein
LLFNKLTEYRKRTISGLKVIKRHALHAGERVDLLNQIAEDLRHSCNLLLNLIIDEVLGKKTVNLPHLENVYDLKVISTEDIEA